MLQVLSVDGKLVRVERLVSGSGTVQLGLEALPAGIYFVVLVTDRATIAQQRLVVTGN